MLTWNHLSQRCEAPSGSGGGGSPLGIGQTNIDPVFGIGDSARRRSEESGSTKIGAVPNTSFGVGLGSGRDSKDTKQDVITLSGAKNKAQSISANVVQSAFVGAANNVVDTITGVPPRGAGRGNSSLVGDDNPWDVPDAVAVGGGNSNLGIGDTQLSIGFGESEEESTDRATLPIPVVAEEEEKFDLSKFASDLVIQRRDNYNFEKNTNYLVKFTIIDFKEKWRKFFVNKFGRVTTKPLFFVFLQKYGTTNITKPEPFIINEDGSGNCVISIGESTPRNVTQILRIQDKGAYHVEPITNNIRVYKTKADGSYYFEGELTPQEEAEESMAKANNARNKGTLKDAASDLIYAADTIPDAAPIVEKVIVASEAPTKPQEVGSSSSVSQGVGQSSSEVVGVGGDHKETTISTRQGIGIGIKGVGIGGGLASANTVLAKMHETAAHASGVGLAGASAVAVGAAAVGIAGGAAAVGAGSSQGIMSATGAGIEGVQVDPLISSNDRDSFLREREKFISFANGELTPEKYQEYLSQLNNEGETLLEMQLPFDEIMGMPDGFGIDPTQHSPEQLEIFGRVFPPSNLANSVSGRVPIEESPYYEDFSPLERLANGLGNQLELDLGIPSVGVIGGVSDNIGPIITPPSGGNVRVAGGNTPNVDSGGDSGVDVGGGTGVGNGGRLPPRLRRTSGDDDQNDDQDGDEGEEGDDNLDRGAFDNGLHENFFPLPSRGNAGRSRQSEEELAQSRTLLDKLKSTKLGRAMRSNVPGVAPSQKQKDNVEDKKQQARDAVGIAKKTAATVKAGLSLFGLLFNPAFWILVAAFLGLIIILPIGLVSECDAVANGQPIAIVRDLIVEPIMWTGQIVSNPVDVAKATVGIAYNALTLKTAAGQGVLPPSQLRKFINSIPGCADASTNKCNTDEGGNVRSVGGIACKDEVLVYPSPDGPSKVPDVSFLPDNENLYYIMLGTRAKEFSSFSSNKDTTGDADSCGAYQQRVREYFKGGSLAGTAKSLLGEEKYNKVFRGKSISSTSNSYGYPEDGTEAEANEICKSLMDNSDYGFFDKVFIERVKNYGKLGKAQSVLSPEEGSGLIEDVQGAAVQVRGKIASMIKFAKEKNLFAAKKAKCGVTASYLSPNDNFAGINNDTRFPYQINRDNYLSEAFGFGVRATEGKKPIDTTLDDHKDTLLSRFNKMMKGSITVEASSDIKTERQRLSTLISQGLISSQDGNDVQNALKDPYDKNNASRNEADGGWSNNVVLTMLKLYDSGITFRTGASNRRAGGTATISGGKSDHGYGNAMDLVGFSKSKSWKDNAEKYFFIGNGGKGLSETGKPGGVEVFKDAIKVLKSSGVLKPTQLLVPPGYDDIGADLSSSIEPSGALHFAVLADKTFDGSGVTAGSSPGGGGGAGCKSCEKSGNSGGATSRANNAVINRESMVEPADKGLIKSKKFAVIHYTVGDMSAKEQNRILLERAKNNQEGYAHYLIDKDGTNYLLVDEKYKVKGVATNYSGYFEGNTQTANRARNGSNDQDNGANYYSVQYEVHYKPQDKVNPPETITDAQLKSLAELIKKAGFNKNQIMNHWSLQPESRFDATDWIRSDGTITESLKKFTKYAGFATTDADAEKVAKEISLANINNAIKVLENSVIEPSGSESQNASYEPTKILRGANTVLKLDDLKAARTRLGGNSTSNIPSGSIPNPLGSIEVSAANSSSSNTASNSSAKPTIADKEFEALYYHNIQKITDPGYENPPRDKIYVDTKNKDVKVGDRIKLTIAVNPNGVIGDDKKNAQVVFEVAKKIDLKDDGGIMPIRLNSNDLVKFLTPAGNLDGLYKFKLYVVPESERDKNQVGTADTLTPSEIDKNCPNGESTNQAGDGQADGDFAAIVKRYATKGDASGGRGCEANNVPNRNGKLTGCCYGAIWAALNENKSKNPNSGWAKAMPVLDKYTEGDQYSIPAKGFHLAMQRTTSSGNKAYEEAGLVFTKDHKAAPIGSIVVVDTGTMVGSSAGDINAKYENNKWANYATMTWMPSTPANEILGVYFPKK